MFVNHCAQGVKRACKQANRASQIDDHEGATSRWCDKIVSMRRAGSLCPWVGESCL